MCTTKNEVDSLFPDQPLLVSYAQTFFLTTLRTLELNRVISAGYNRCSVARLQNFLSSVPQREGRSELIRLAIV